MSENIYQGVGGQTVIIYGGDPLPGCPTDWDSASEWAKQVNGDKFESKPVWEWDCGFKLDFEGPLINVSSRFYPPKSHYGATWDGTVTIGTTLGNASIEKKFDCPTLEELHRQVTEFVHGFAASLEQAFVVAAEKVVEAEVQPTTSPAQNADAHRAGGE